MFLCDAQVPEGQREEGEVQEDHVEFLQAALVCSVYIFGDFRFYASIF